MGEGVDPMKKLTRLHVETGVSFNRSCLDDMQRNVCLILFEKSMAYRITPSPSGRGWRGAPGEGHHVDHPSKCPNSRHPGGVPERSATPTGVATDLLPPGVSLHFASLNPWLMAGNPLGCKAASMPANIQTSDPGAGARAWRLFQPIPTNIIRGSP